MNIQTIVHQNTEKRLNIVIAAGPQLEKVKEECLELIAAIDEHRTDYVNSEVVDVIISAYNYLTSVHIYANSAILNKSYSDLILRSVD